MSPFRLRPARLAVGFRGKQIILLTLVAAAVALTTSATNALLLARGRLEQIRAEAVRLGQITYHQASRTIREHKPAELREALGSDPALRDTAQAVVGYSPIVLYVAIVDADDRAVFHTTAALQGQVIPPGHALEEFTALDAILLLAHLANGERTLVARLPFSVDASAAPFGTVRVAVSTGLLRDHLLGDVLTSALLAAVVVLAAFGTSGYLANRLLAPLEVLRRELARLDPGDGPPLDFRGEADLPRLATFFATVSERLEREKSGDESRHAWLGEVLGGVADAVIVVGRDRRVLSLNGPAATLIGRAREEVVGSDLMELLPREHPVVEAVRMARRTRGNVVKLQAEIEVAGQRTPYLLNAHVLREGQDSTGVMVAAVDLGRLSRMASRLAYSQKLATLGELTSGVAHEIKNPLHAMVMHIALMRRKLREDTPPEITRHLDVLDEEIRRLDRVVQGFLQFSRPEELRLTVLDLAQVLRTCVDQVRDRAEASRIGVELAGADAEIPVWGEEDLLRQAFSNLLGNAVEAMPEGGRLRVSSERQNGWAHVRIEDSGVGIAESELPHVFRLYYTTKTGGSGIGLAVVHRVVELHGGNLSIESRPGQGTSVTVALPGDVS